jgi:hypothetical protein
VNRARATLADYGRFLTFRFRHEDYDRLGWPHLALGVLCTWLVGIGRNWDLATAPPYAKAGLGSLAYILVFSLVLWCFARPLAGPGRSYVWMLTVISMTAIPGLVYAIPVERFMPLQDAQITNLAFLAFVATWRVCLAFHVLLRGMALGQGESLAAMALPICLLIIGLVQSGRAKATFELMGGLRDATPTSQDSVNAIVLLLYCLSVPGAAVAFIFYMFTYWKTSSQR